MRNLDGDLRLQLFGFVFALECSSQVVLGRGSLILFCYRLFSLLGRGPLFGLRCFVCFPVLFVFVSLGFGVQVKVSVRFLAMFFG